MKEGGGGGRDSSQKKLEAEWRWWGRGAHWTEMEERRSDLDEECGKVRDPTRGQSGQTKEGHIDEKERIRKPEESCANRKA